MRISVFIWVIMVLIFFGCAVRKKEASLPSVSEQQFTADFDYSEQSTWLLGYFSRDQISREPHSGWYLKGYDDYQYNEDVINNLLEINKDELKIKIILGTWCPDSRREVPRFMRILDSWDFPEASVVFIGVDDAKLSPVGEYNDLNILRVPTFIIYKNNIEAGRIIETPVTSLEQDMVNILERNE